MNVRTNDSYKPSARPMGSKPPKHAGQPRLAQKVGQTASNGAGGVAGKDALELGGTTRPQGLSDIGQAIAKVIKHPFVGGNEVKFFPDGAKAFPEMYRIIDSAHKRLDIEVFAIHNDATGFNLVEKHLAPKVKAHVPVNFLYDGPANIFYGSVIKKAKKLGIKMLKWTDGMGDLGAYDPAVVDHKKVILSDGKEAWIGGDNFGDRYRKYWHDGGASVKGPVIAYLYDEFTENWDRSDGGELKSVHRILSPQGLMNATVVVTRPEDHELKRAVFAAIDAAKVSVMVQTPYLTDDALIEHLVRAAERGVDVEVQIPSVSDHEICDTIADEATNRLIRAGAKVHRYDTANYAVNADFLTGQVDHDPATDHFNHFKLMTVDHKVAFVGTANGDDRSLDDNQEIDLIVDNPAFTQQVDQMLQNDFATRSPLAKEKPLTTRQKIAGFFLNLAKFEF